MFGTSVVAARLAASQGLISMQLVSQLRTDAKWKISWYKESEGIGAACAVKETKILRGL
jgi:hypothetical protein